MIENMRTSGDYLAVGLNKPFGIIDIDVSDPHYFQNANWQAYISSFPDGPRKDRYACCECRKRRRRTRRQRRLRPTTPFCSTRCCDVWKTREALRDAEGNVAYDPATMEYYDGKVWVSV